MSAYFDKTVTYLDLAADYCAKLAAIDHAYILGDEDEVAYMLDNVDPIDARLVANELRALAIKLRGAVGDGSLSFPAVAPAVGGQAQASAPDSPGHSTKVPCS